MIETAALPLQKLHMPSLVDVITSGEISIFWTNSTPELDWLLLCLVGQMPHPAELGWPGCCIDQQAAPT